MASTSRVTRFLTTFALLLTTGCEADSLVVLHITKAGLNEVEVRLYDDPSCNRAAASSSDVAIGQELFTKAGSGFPTDAKLGIPIGRKWQNKVVRIEAVARRWAPDGTTAEEIYWCGCPILPDAGKGRGMPMRAVEGCALQYCEPCESKSADSPCVGGGTPEPIAAESCSGSKSCFEGRCVAQDGSTCDANDQCSTTCVEGTCATLSSMQGACDPGDADDCEAGLLCPGGLCLVATGDACDVDNDCLSNRCLSNICTAVDCAGAASSVLCRRAVGDCDLEEFCDGAGSCMPDQVRANNHVCRPVAGLCDVADLCDGTSPGCPTDVVLDSTNECRARYGTGCDVAESCDGTLGICPDDVGFQPPSPESCLLHDDFESDLIRWNTPGSGDWSIQAGELVQSASNDYHQMIVSMASFAAPLSMQADVTTTIPTNEELTRLIFGYRDGGNFCVVFASKAYGVAGIAEWSNAQRTVSEVNYNYSINNRYTFRLELNGNNVDFFIDGALVVSDTVSNNCNSGGVGFSTDMAASRFDNVLVTN